jgi:exopolyphosphatase/guanosine-5'-triphosphate,3'-diphosphate pyrophosphatase
MKPSRLAVIDLGSNTFHLLIVEILSNGEWITLAKDRRYVKLASAGLDQISHESIERGVSVMKEFAVAISQYQVDRTFAIGTAALREAKNGTEVARLLEQESGIPIKIIDGLQEAEYILKGIKSVLPPLDRPCLIMDIGGGSVEFILFSGDKVLFDHSFKIGVAVLYRLFHQQDPISAEQIEALEEHLSTILTPVWQQLNIIKEYYLIGASGSFEVIQDVQAKKQAAEHWSELNLDKLDDYLSGVIQMEVSTRSLQKEIPVERLDYIVVAYILIRYLLRRQPPTRLFYCDYALKEGVIVAHS